MTGSASRGRDEVGSSRLQDQPDGPRPFTIGLVAHPSKPVTASVGVIEAWVRGRPVDLVVRHSDAGRVGDAARVVEEQRFVDLVDAVVSLGGDGTMLGAMRLVADRAVPVLGVNHGNLGFLVEVAPDELSDALTALEEGHYVLEPHGCLVVEAGAQTSVALNDVVVSGPGGQRGVTVDLEVEGASYGYYRCDALVVATALGSTAYNYAAGGPVISSAASAMAVTPVAPISGISHSVVLGSDDVITLRCRDADGALMAYSTDGTSPMDVMPDGSITVRHRRAAATVVRLAGQAHARRSRIQLSLQDLPFRREDLEDLGPRPQGWSS